MPRIFIDWVFYSLVKKWEMKACYNADVISEI